MTKITPYSERKAAIAAHNARETQKAVDDIRGKRQAAPVAYEAARDKSGRA